jgi:hypothetical protein
VNYTATGRRKDELRQWVKLLKMQGKCSHCPEADWRLLDHHHVEPQKKLLAISRMVQLCYSRETIEEELAKCILLCLNCHRRLHLTDSSLGRKKKRQEEVATSPPDITKMTTQDAIEYLKVITPKNFSQTPAWNEQRLHQVIDAYLRTRKPQNEVAS